MDDEGPGREAERRGPEPRTRVDRRSVWGRRPAPGAVPDRPSRLGAVPHMRVDPEAATRRSPSERARFDPEAPTRRKKDAPTRVDPEARTRVAPEARTRVNPRRPGGTPSTPGTSGTPADGVGPSADSRPAADRSFRGEYVGGFPAALRERFEPLGVAGSGTEGTVWYVRRTDGRGEAAVKVAAVGQSMDAELLDHLSNDAYRRHVPRIVDSGRVTHQGVPRDWVAMEYLPVTLADHFAALRREGRHTDPRATEIVIYELVSLLDFWQQRIRRNPVDFKPANVLVRPGRPPGEFVIADFGGIARLTASRRFTPEMTITVAYMAPEQLAGTNHPAGPWWALGNILYELFTGRPRFLDPHGRLLSDEVLQYDLVMSEEVDLSAVADPRRLLLLQGLFTKNPAERWTAPQVRSWLAGGSPEVARHRARAAGGRTHRPVTFFGTPHHDPAGLAVALLARSADAARWLTAGGAERLRDWLRDEVKDTVFDLHYLTDVTRARSDRRDAVAALAVLAFGAAFAPSATPRYLDRPIDTAGLERIATDPDGAAFVDALVAAGVPAVAARYDCFHPECSGDHCSRLLALAQLPDVLAAVNDIARSLGGGRRGGDGLGTDEREEAHRLAVRLTVRPEERDRLIGRLSPLPTALHRLPLPGQLSDGAVVLAAVVADGVLGARSAVGGKGADRTVLRRWSALRRRAVAADPAELAGRAALVAAEALRTRAGRRTDAPAQARQPGRGPGRRQPALDPKAVLRAWWPHLRTAWPRRAGAAVLLLVAFGLLLWAGAVFRYPIDAGQQLKIWPNGAFGGPLRRVGDHAAHQVVGQLGAALTAAVVLAVFPARVGFGTAALTGAGAFTIGYLRLGAPMTVLRPPQPVADRVVTFEGGMGSWAGVVAVVALVGSLVLIERASGRLLRPAHDARRRAGEAWRRAAGRPVPPPANVKLRRQWPSGRAGVRDRALFALGSTFVLVTLLWAAVEVRLAAVATGHHAAPASWGTGQVGASYQAGFAILLAVLSGTAALAAPRTARALFAVWIAGTLLLGAWPNPLGPFEALRIPVLQPMFGNVASWWGHSAFWAAVLIALPLAALGVLVTVRRSGRR
ncbi:protein kinase domain-containing protein [Kitasatospora sp. NPDC001660]